MVNVFGDNERRKSVRFLYTDLKESVVVVVVIAVVVVIVVVVVVVPVARKQSCNNNYANLTSECIQRFGFD